MVKDADPANAGTTTEPVCYSSVQEWTKGHIGLDDQPRRGAHVTSGVPVDRRTRHRQRRRDEVYDAAVALFVEQGFDNTSMEQIADRADVARATVFNPFSRKTVLLDEWTARRRQQAEAAVHAEDVETWSLEQILRRYMTEMAKLSEESRPETVALMTACLHNTNLLAHPALADQLKRFVVDAQQAGEAPTGINADQAAVLVAISYFSVLSQWIAEEPAPFDLKTELLAMLDLVLNGVVTPRAAEPSRRNTKANAAPRRGGQTTPRAGRKRTT